MVVSAAAPCNSLGSVSVLYEGRDHILDVRFPGFAVRKSGKAACGQAAGRDPMDGKWKLLLEPVEPFVNDLRLGLRVREDRAGWHRANIALRCHKGQRAGLHAGAKADVFGDCAHFSLMKVPP